MEVRKKRKKHVKYNGRLSLLPPSFGEKKIHGSSGKEETVPSSTVVVYIFRSLKKSSDLAFVAGS